MAKKKKRQKRSRELLRIPGQHVPTCPQADARWALIPEHERKHYGCTCAWDRANGVATSRPAG